MRSSIQKETSGYLPEREGRLSKVPSHGCATIDGVTGTPQSSEPTPPCLNPTIRVIKPPPRTLRHPFPSATASHHQNLFHVHRQMPLGRKEVALQLLVFVFPGVVALPPFAAVKGSGREQWLVGACFSPPLPLPLPQKCGRKRWDEAAFMVRCSGYLGTIGRPL
jgi:hypothetical protein